MVNRIFDSAIPEILRSFSAAAAFERELLLAARQVTEVVGPLRSVAEIDAAKLRRALLG